MNAEEKKNGWTREVFGVRRTHRQRYIFSGGLLCIKCVQWSEWFRWRTYRVSSVTHVLSHAVVSAKCNVREIAYAFLCTENRLQSRENRHCGMHWNPRIHWKLRQRSAETWLTAATICRWLRGAFMFSHATTICMFCLRRVVRERCIFGFCK